MNSVNTTTNTFCGPAALSIILNKPTDECEALLQSIRRNKRQVKGAYLSELAAVLTHMGKVVKYQTLTPLVGRSLFFSMTVMEEDGLYVFLIPGHFVVIEKNKEQRYLCDNHTKKPLNAASSARLNQRVLDCFKVE
jgi:hypothetical protein